MNDALKQKILERAAFNADAFYHELYRLWDAKEECGAERMVRWQSERDTALVTELLELVARNEGAFEQYAMRPFINALAEQASADITATLERLSGGQ